MSLPLSPHSSNSTIDLTLIEEISRSILTNLDRDGLLNSIVTLLHQLFGLTDVYIYSARGLGKTTLKRIGITANGLEPEILYYFDQEFDPIGWCVSHLEFLVINKSDNDNRFAQFDFKEATKSKLILPLVQGDFLVGLLELRSDTDRVFIPETVQVFKLLADKIAIAIRNANLYRSEQLKRCLYERIYMAVGSLSVDETPDSISKTLLEELDAFIPCDACAIWLVETQMDDPGLGQFTNTYRMAGIKCQDQSNLEIFEPYLQNYADNSELFVNFPWINELVNNKTPTVRSAGFAFEPLGGLLNFERNYSALAAPMLFHDQLMGIVICAHHLPDQYDEEQISIAQTFGDYSAVAVENARLYRVAHDQAWISTVLLQVAESTQSITNLDDLLEIVARLLPGLIGTSSCAIFLWDPSVETFFGSASYGFGEEQTARLNSWNIPVGSVVAFEELKYSRSPVILNKENVEDEVSAIVFPEYELNENLLILFPLLTQNFINGAILVDFSNSELSINSSQELWDEKYTLIQGAARQVAIAIENLQLIKAQEEEAYISVALLQVAQAVVSLNQLDEILATIIRITPLLVGVKRCIIYIWDSKDRVFRQSQNYGFSKNDLASMGAVLVASEFPLVEAIQQSGRIISHSLGPEDLPNSWCEITSDDFQVVENISSSNEEISIGLDDKALAARERLLIGFPLSVKAETLGVMLIEEGDPLKGKISTHVREKRVEIVKGITQQAAIAIKNEQLQQEAVKSERMERELQLAREIQATFLPDKLPEIPGWDIDVRWQPAREVGGDFYDFLLLEGNKLGFVIADVADKGMPAALFMTLIRTLIRAAAKEKTSPAAVLKQVNELLIPDAKQGIFVTVFYGVISIDTGTLLYANAGHNPPIIKKPETGELFELTRTTIALGIFDDIEVEEKEIKLNYGDWLLLYTDGITEAFSSQEVMFGTERLMSIYKDSAFHSSKNLGDLISNSVNQFIQGSDLSDDITLAVIHRVI